LSINRIAEAPEDAAFRPPDTEPYPPDDEGTRNGDEHQEPPQLKPQSLRKMMTIHTALRPVLIDNLLRIGETLNLISASKIGKTWAVYDLAVSMAAGIPWLGTFQTNAHPVLIVDNELHPETIAHRIPKVAAALGVKLADVEDRIQIQSLRGKLMNLIGLRNYLRQFRPGHFGAIIVDAFYRTLPIDTDENDNGAMANLYNIIDQCADELQACFVFVHHASKGNQSAKQVTDVGSGAGSMSRATDSHLVLRHHDEIGAVVLDAAVRSFAPIEPLCFRWQFPIWSPAPDLDPKKLRREKPRAVKAGAEEKATKAALTVENFVTQFLKAEPQTKDVITIAASLSDHKLSERRATMLLKAATDTGHVHVWKSSNPADGHRFSTEPQPLTESVK
jgi:hypothetical protein